MLTFIALICRALGWYPLWLLLFTLDGRGDMFPAMGVLFGVSLVSAGCLRILLLRLYAHKRLAFLLSLLQTFLAAAAAAAGCRLLGCGMFISILAAAVTVISTHCRLRGETDTLFPVNAFAAFLSGVAVSTAMLRIAHQTTYIMQTIAVAGFVAALFFLLRNQLMLRRFVNRRSSTATDVPQEIRRSNLLMVGGIIALLAVVFIFHEPLVRLLLQIQNALIRLLFALAGFILHLVERLKGDPPSEILEETAEDVTRRLASGSHSPLWLLLWIPYIAVAVFIWREFLSDWVYDIRMLLQDLRARLRKQDKAAAQIRRTEREEYYDTETKLKRENKSSRLKKEWRRALRRWQSMPDGSEKFYKGYRLLLDAPCWTENLLLDSDTVREVREKWAAYYTPQDALDAVTADFHADRYAEKGLPAEAIRDLTAALVCIRNTHEP